MVYICIYLFIYFLFCLQNLQVKMRGHGFPWSKLLMVLLVFAAGFIAHDIRSHGSFAGLSVSCLLVTITSFHFYGRTCKAASMDLVLVVFFFLRSYNVCCVFQIPPQPSICATQGSQPYLSRPGAKQQSTPNRVSGTTSPSNIHDLLLMCVKQAFDQ